MTLVSCKQKTCFQTETGNQEGNFKEIKKKLQGRKLLNDYKHNQSTESTVWRRTLHIYKPQPNLHCKND